MFYGNVGPEVIIFTVLGNGNQGIQAVIATMKLDEHQNLIVDTCCCSPREKGIPSQQIHRNATQGEPGSASHRHFPDKRSSLHTQ
jgi:hypothetical protein